MIVSEATDRTKRLRLALQLTQVALATWLLLQLSHRTSEFMFHFLGLRFVGGAWNPVRFAAAFSVLLLACTSVFLATRKIRRDVVFLGGALIFGCLTFQITRYLMAAVNSIWMAIYGRTLVVADPFAPVVARAPAWMIDVIWLLMILGGFAIAAEINAAYQKRLFSPSSFRRLLMFAMLGFGVWVLNAHCSASLLRWWSHTAADPSLDAMIVITTVYGLLVLAPAAIFCVLAIVALRQARIQLLDPVRLPCPHCGFDLRYLSGARCPECGCECNHAR